MFLSRLFKKSPDHPVVHEFWTVFDYLEALQTNEAVNHLPRHHPLIAVNLEQFRRVANWHGHNPPGLTELRKHLKGSRTHKFVCERTVHTSRGRPLHCWVFERPSAHTSRT